LNDILKGASSAELEALKDQMETDRLLQTSLGKDWLAQDADDEDPSAPPSTRRRRSRSDEA
jgi:hypothetical protein